MAGRKPKVTKSQEEVKVSVEFETIPQSIKIVSSDTKSIRELTLQVGLKLLLKSHVNTSVNYTIAKGEPFTLLKEDKALKHSSGDLIKLISKKSNCTSC